MNRPAKLDLRKELKHLYTPSAKVVTIVDVPKYQYAMVDGALEPGQKPAASPAFQEAVQALYGVSFTLKFTSKLRKRNPIDYVVMALEGLWWTDASDFDFNPSKTWRFTLMIMQPEHITARTYQEALEQLQEKKENPALKQLRLETFREGLCVQTMHIGPYDREPATVTRMRSFAEQSGLSLRGKHHEIYLGDPRRCKPERLRTVLRLPVQKNADA